MSNFETDVIYFLITALWTNVDLALQNLLEQASGVWEYYEVKYLGAKFLKYTGYTRYERERERELVGYKRKIYGVGWVGLRFLR